MYSCTIQPCPAAIVFQAYTSGTVLDGSPERASSINVIAATSFSTRTLLSRFAPGFVSRTATVLTDGKMALMLGCDTWRKLAKYTRCCLCQRRGGQSIGVSTQRKDGSDLNSAVNPEASADVVGETYFSSKMLLDDRSYIFATLAVRNSVFRKCHSYISELENVQY